MNRGMIEGPIEDREPSLQNLVAIRVRNWQRLGERLGFTPEELSEIDKYGDRNPHDRYNAIKRKIFGGWKMKYSRQPTNQAVAQALIDAGEHDAAHLFCRTHGINYQRCNSAEREHLKEPEHKVGHLNMVFHRATQRNAFMAHLDETSDKFINLLMATLRPHLMNCDWKKVLDEIRFNLPNYHFYPSINLQFRPEFDDIAPIIFHGRCMRPNETADIQTILQRINSNVNTTTLPRSWYLVVFILFERGDTISLEQYESLAQECNITDDEVFKLLDYVHNHFGLILHYKDIPELKDIVICSSELVLEECCSLFDMILSNSPSSKQTGLVDKSLITSFAQGNKQLSIALTLLKHYHFIVEKVVSNRVYYFIPLLLNKSRSNSSFKSKPDEVFPAPVLICFPKKAAVPCGVFDSLHGCLAELENFPLNGSNYYRNMMGFIVNSVNVVLISQKKFIELRILADLVRISTVTYDIVLSNLTSALEAVSSIYGGESFDFQFTCPGSRYPQLHKSKPIEDFKLQCCGQTPCRVLEFNCQTKHMVWKMIWSYKLGMSENMDIDQSLTATKVDSDIKMLETQLKEEGGVPFRVAKVVLYGPPGCGKTTVCRRLTGQLSNLSSDPEHAPTGSSGIEDPVTINLYHTVDQTTVLVNGSQQNTWTPQTIQQQVEMLFCYLHVKKSIQTPSCAAGNFSQTSIEPMETSIPSTINALPHGHSTIPQSMLFSASNTHNSVVAQPVVPRNTSSDQLTSPSSSSQQKHELRTKSSIVFNTLKRMVQNKEWPALKDLFAHIEDSTLLSIIDTGGQPEFHDILPQLIRGPAVFLVFLRLIDSLDEKFPVSYRIEGTESMVYESMYTPRNIIHQVLALCHSLGEEYAALLVGSYKDQVTPHDIEKMNESLKLTLKNAIFFNQDHLKRYNGKHYIYPIDNMNGNAKEIKQLQEFIFKNVKKFQKSPKLLPPSWYLFHLMLKYLYEGSKTCTLEKAIEHASELSIKEEDVPRILEFIDHNFGTILYYSSIPSLQNTVICDPSAVFKPIAKLVGESFGANPDHPTASEAIRNSGMVSVALVDLVCSESNTVIPLESIIEILKEANVVTEIKGTNGEMGLFMPFLLLPDPSVETCNTDLSGPAPLIFNFALSSFLPQSSIIDVPVGLFIALVIKLSQPESPKWVLHPQRQRFKNRVQFYFYNDNDLPSVVELVSRISSIQVSFVENPNPRKCVMVREEMYSEIKEIMASHSYMKNIEMRVGFLCPGSTNYVSPHPANVRDHKVGMECPPSIECAENCQPCVYTLKVNQKMWFINQVEYMDTATPQQSPQQVTAMALPNNSIPAYYDNKHDNESMETETEILHNDCETVIKVLRAINTVPSDKWQVLGLLLHLEQNVVRQMLKESGNEFTNFQMTFIAAWLDTGRATWNDLVNSLKDVLVGQNAIANKITEKYIQSPAAGHSLINDVD